MTKFNYSSQDQPPTIVLCNIYRSHIFGIHHQKLPGFTTEQDRQCACKSNTEARSRDHSCRGKAISITHSECVCSLSYPAREAHAPYCTVSCGLSGATIFCRIISLTARFSEKVIEHKMCVFISSTTFV
jgi:hypothetical protein